MEHLAVAIDGPSGAGKSTVARAAAARLGFIYVDTGAMYRAIGLSVCRRGVAEDDTAGILASLEGLDVSLRYENGAQHVLLGGEDVSDAIRTPRIAQYASKVSAVPEVRQFLLGLQRGMARENDVIMDGRDIGTVILPDAQVKIFLTASVACRAKRRYDELCQKGLSVTLEGVAEDIARRDKQDSTRAVAPLRQAEDAVRLDTSGLTLDESIETTVRIIREKGGLA